MSGSHVSNYAARAYNFTAQYTNPLSFSDGLIVEVLNYKYYTGLLTVIFVWFLILLFISIPLPLNWFIRLQNQITSLMDILNVFRLGPTIIRREDIDGSPNFLDRIRRKHNRRFKGQHDGEGDASEIAQHSSRRRSRRVAPYSMRLKWASGLGSFFGCLAVYAILVGLYLSGQYASSYKDYCDYTLPTPANEFVNLQRTTEVLPLFHLFKESPDVALETRKQIEDYFIRHQLSFLLSMGNFTVNPLHQGVNTSTACAQLAHNITLECRGGVRCTNVTRVEESASAIRHTCVVNVSASMSFSPRGYVALQFPSLQREDSNALSNFDSINVSILSPAVIDDAPSTLYIQESIQLGSPCTPPPNDTATMMTMATQHTSNAHPYDSSSSSSSSHSFSQSSSSSSSPSTHSSWQSLDDDDVEHLSMDSKRNLRVCSYTLQQHFIMTQFQDCDLFSTAAKDYSTDYFVTYSYVDIDEEKDNQTQFALHYTLYSDQTFVFNKQTKLLSFNTVLVYSFIGAASIYGFVGLVAATMTTVLHYGLTIVSFVLFLALMVARTCAMCCCIMMCRRSKSEAKRNILKAEKRAHFWTRERREEALPSSTNTASSPLLGNLSVNALGDSYHSDEEGQAMEDAEGDIVVW